MPFGEISMVSEQILLQTLSMKLLSVILHGSKPTLQWDGLKEKTYSGLCSTKPYYIPASNSARVFVRGQEDEFSELALAAFYGVNEVSKLVTLTTTDMKHVDRKLKLCQDPSSHDKYC
ncbi:hypothetical protein RHMOL_Rhmol05G0309700 [Rhododendron molle]|uniref:Uncharacterized protein n=2 Tax=Rhododendron molle TaxID=49168 RepID=A0ACC0NX48_RHOML|nr:hypothetical protein RHMOL_Rhmol05G0309700 [Rhododendron molle]KAI8557113.1 hypothetical protein RHMOL_Rhmol05G0309700 [Rhododendron molle]